MIPVIIIAGAVIAWQQAKIRRLRRVRVSVSISSVDEPNRIARAVMRDLAKDRADRSHGPN